MGLPSDKLNGVLGWLGRKVKATVGNQTTCTLDLFLAIENHNSNVRA